MSKVEVELWWEGGDAGGGRLKKVEVEGQRRSNNPWFLLFKDWAQELGLLYMGWKTYLDQACYLVWIYFGFWFNKINLAQGPIM